MAHFRFGLHEFVSLRLRQVQAPYILIALQLPDADLAILLRSRQANPHHKEFRCSPLVLDFYGFARSTETSNTIHTSSPAAYIARIRGLMKCIPLGIGARDDYWQANKSSRLEAIAHR